MTLLIFVFVKVVSLRDSGGMVPENFLQVFVFINAHLPHQIPIAFLQSVFMVIHRFPGVVQMGS